MKAARDAPTGIPSGLCKSVEVTRFPCRSAASVNSASKQFCCRRLRHSCLLHVLVEPSSLVEHSVNVVPRPGDPMRLAGILDHLRGHAILLDRHIELLVLRERHAVVDLAVDEQ